MRAAEMKRIVGVGTIKERKRLLKLLAKLGCVEISHSEYERLSPPDKDESAETARHKLSRLAFAHSFISEERRLVKDLKKKKEYTGKIEKKPLVRQKPEIEYDKFALLQESEGEVFDRIAVLEKLNGELIDIKSKEAKSLSAIAQVAGFEFLELPLSRYQDTSKAAVKLGAVPINKEERLVAIKEAYPDVDIEWGKDLSSNDIRLAYICLKENAEHIAEELAEIDFQEADLRNFQDTSSAVREQELAKLEEYKARRNQIAYEVIEEFDNLQFIDELRLIEDYYNVELQMLEAERGMPEGKTAYLFKGWLPDSLADKVDEKLADSDLALAYIIRSAEDGETPPTLMMNNAIVTPYESITNMFSVPNVNELDPNPFVAFFFILFFGLMVSDAGYGLMLTIASAIVLFIAKPRKNEMPLVKVILGGGISTIFWGVLFGGYFGIEGIPPIWFNPIDEPMMMMVLSLGLGLFQMLTGLALNAYQLFRQKKPLDAIFGVFSWYFLVIGVGMFMLGASIEGVKYAGIAILVLGLLGLMAAGALHAKGIKRLTGAFGGLYGIVNFFSDLLSYTRLFGLGLATGVIALVFNQIAMVIFDMNVFIGAVLGPIILVVGHVFNVGINTLGAYVHNSRLQFVEFFGKFYTGGGYLFKPLGSEMKYYNFTQIKEEKK